MKAARFSALVCCYGDYPYYSLRAVHSLLEKRSGADDSERAFAIHVGACACARETIRELRDLLDSRQIDSLFETTENINKDPMKRLLIDRADTEYYFWIDDDTHLREGWDDELTKFIEKNVPFDLAGIPKAGERLETYTEFLKQRPWFVDMEKFQGQARDVSVFVLGSAYLARVGFVRQHNYPDKAMVKKFDDALLGDLVSQQNGRLLSFPESLRSLICENDGQRRGDGEDKNFLLHCNPKTGESSEQKTPEVRTELIEPVVNPSAAEQRPQDSTAPRIKKITNNIVELNRLGNEAKVEGRLEEALAYYREALIFAPDEGALHFNCANTLRELKRMPEAIDCFKKALELNPGDANSLNNFGQLLFEEGQAHQAIEYYKRALLSDPEMAVGHYNLGTAQFHLGRYQEALASLRLAIHHSSSFVPAHYLLGLVWLYLGDAEQGLPEFEWRSHLRGNFKRDFRQPLWDGADRQGQRVLVHCDNDESDLLRCLRYLTSVRERGTVILQAPKKILPIVTGLPDIEVVPEKTLLPRFDTHASLQSLQLILKIFDTNAVPSSGYLTTPRPATSEKTHGRMQVGLVLSTDVRQPHETNRSIDALHFEELLEIPGIDWHLLPDAPGNTTPSTHRDELSPVGPFTDYGAYATQLNQLDLVVGVDSPALHLAAALGTSTWLIASPVPAWQWGAAGTESIWYQSVRVFRQSERGKYSDILKEIASELKTRISLGDKRVDRRAESRQPYL